MPLDRIDVLESLSIRFSPLKSLNDPFEELTLIDISDKKERLKHEFIKEIDDIYDSDISDRTEEDRLIMETEKSKMSDEMNHRLDPSSVGDNFKSEFCSDLGVLSLSRTNTSLLMWSHYASEGKGFVVAFDEQHPFFNIPDPMGNATKFKPVSYSRDRPKIKLDDLDTYEKLFFKKPLEWEYEEEERILRRFSNKDGDFKKDSYGQDIVLSYLPPETIKSIYFGYRMEGKIKERIFSALNKHGVKCPVFSSRICDNSYSIIFNKER